MLTDQHCSDEKNISVETICRVQLRENLDQHKSMWMCGESNNA